MMTGAAFDCPAIHTPMFLHPQPDIDARHLQGLKLLDFRR
jgi:hypothetical protein